jgi:hypothetical protein
MIQKLILILSGLILLFGGCFESVISDEDPPNTNNQQEPDYDYYSLDMSDKYLPEGFPVGIVPQNEISGIEWSTGCNGGIWSINDNDNGPLLFLLDTGTAEIRYTFQFEKISNTDWEALSLADGVDGKSYLYIGDIGNNDLKRIKLRIYRIVEPDCPNESMEIIKTTAEYELLEFIYPDGPHDAEAMFVDEETLDIYIITKERSRSGVYRLPYPWQVEGTDTLNYLGSLPFPYTVAADYCAEEKILLVKTYDQIFIWQNTMDKRISDLIFDIPRNAPYDPIELQGESICIGIAGYFTLSEKVFGIDPVLYRYKQKETD